MSTMQVKPGEGDIAYITSQVRNAMETCMKRCMSLQVFVSGKASLAGIALEWLIWCILQARGDGRHIDLTSRRETKVVM